MPPRIDRAPRREHYKGAVVRFEEIVLGQNARLFSGNVDELSRDIGSNGLLNPLLVRDLGNGAPRKKRYRLIAGFRRYEAITLIRKKDRARFEKISVSLFDQPGELAESLANLAENHDRHDLSVLELGRRCVGIKEKFKLSGSDIAERIGYSRGHIDNCMRIVQKCVPEILETLERAGREGIDSGIKFSELVEWARLPAEKQKAKFQESHQWQQGKKAKGLLDDEATRPRMLGRKKAAQLVKALDRRSSRETKLARESVRWLMGLRKNPPIPLRAKPE